MTLKHSAFGTLSRKPRYIVIIDNSGYETVLHGSIGSPIPKNGTTIVTVSSASNSLDTLLPEPAARSSPNNNTSLLSARRRHSWRCIAIQCHLFIQEKHHNTLSLLVHLHTVLLPRQITLPKTHASAFLIMHYSSKSWNRSPPLNNGRKFSRNVASNASELNWAQNNRSRRRVWYGSLGCRLSLVTPTICHFSEQRPWIRSLGSGFIVGKQGPFPCDRATPSYEHPLA